MEKLLTLADIYEAMNIFEREFGVAPTLIRVSDADMRSLMIDLGRERINFQTIENGFYLHSFDQPYLTVRSVKELSQGSTILSEFRSEIAGRDHMDTFYNAHREMTIVARELGEKK